MLSIGRRSLSGPFGWNAVYMDPGEEERRRGGGEEPRSHHEGLQEDPQPSLRPRRHDPCGGWKERKRLPSE